ncbi:MAG: S16 family serine protease [Candidatus Norongarragalinales archaeon]
MRKKVFFLVVACAVIALVVGYETGGVIAENKCLQAQQAQALPTLFPTVIAQQRAAEALSEEFSVRLKLPAVDKNDKGALADLIVERSAGDSAVFVKFSGNSPLINPDTQASLRTALDVAQRVSGKTLSGKNLYYSISTSSDVVGGRSAGAAMTVATIAVLKGEALRPDALVTGTIEADGSIGQVGKVYQKALALKEEGFNLFVVPEGEGKQSIPTESCEEKTEPDGTQSRECTTTYKIIDIGKEVGIRVVEVKNIREAYALLKR